MFVDTNINMEVQGALATDMQIKLPENGLLVFVLDYQKGVSCRHSSVLFNLF
jgi:hypothetical protein